MFIDLPKVFAEVSFTLPTCWQAVPIFLVMVVLETMIRLFQGKGAIRLNSSLMSISHGIMFQGNTHQTYK